MTDEEKILSDLKGIAEYFMELYREEEDHHIYDQHYDRMVVVSNACNLIEELLKNQEPKLTDGSHCPSCGFGFGWAIDEMGGTDIISYCPHCGKVVKWDD